MVVARRTIVGSRAWTCCTCRLLSTATERRPSQRLPISPARTRFAPSPTGYLHLGSLRTALFNYLLAKATGGKFILRVEDTDKTRTVEDAESRLYQDLKWAGLQWDEGPDIGGFCGPYKQSQRTSLYQGHAKKLLDSGHAYRCFCSLERLNNLAKERSDLGLPTDYDRMCTNISKAEADERSTNKEPHIVRLKMPDLPPFYNDLIYGPIGQRRKTEKSQIQCAGLGPSYEDPVLIKSDGLPTYHLANVVDDHNMGITHVIRAVEWMPSTPKHMVLYKAFDWEPPTFAHVGLLLDDSRQKLSKRGLATDIRGFEKDGFFAEALINFVALFGWSHRLGDDFINLQDLVKNFDLKFTKGNTIASPSKLFYLQRRYAEKYISEGGKEYESLVNRLHTVVAKHLGENHELQIWPNDELRDRIAVTLRLDAANYTTPEDFFSRLSPLLSSQPRRQWESHAEDHVLKDNMSTIVQSFREVSCERWSEANLRDVISQMASALEAGGNGDGDSTHRPVPTAGKRRMSIVKHFLRWALFGGRSGPALTVMMNVLGRELSLERIEDAAAELNTIIPNTADTTTAMVGL